MEAFFQLRKVDEEKRLVYGRATQEIVDRSGEIMDYETSKPLIEAWSLEASAASGGLSKGNVRSQHRKDSASGKVVEIEFDDTSKWVDVAVKVVDDADWKKVQEGVYTGFSMGGSYAKKWSDPTLTTASGRPVVRYTAQPSEISLVDRPCVPTAGFFEVLKADGSTEQKAFHQGENNMSTETPPVEEPGQEEAMKKGLWEAKGLIQAIQDLKFLHNQIGEGGKCGPELEEQIRELGQLALAYLAEELGEHIGLTVDDSMDLDAILGASSETDMDTDDDGNPVAVEKGDFPGHPFRGNQYKRGGKGGAHHGASRSAHLATVRAHKTGDKSSHRAAANYHRQASAAHRAAGNARMASHHKEQAAYHIGTAGRLHKSDESPDLSKAARNGRKALRGELGEALAKCNELHKSYIDTYAKGDDEDAEKAKSVVDLVKSDNLDGRIAAAVAAALAPHLETLTKSAPVALVAPQRPHLRALDKADDGLTPRGEDPNAELRKAAENGDSLAAIKLAHKNPTRI